MILQNKLASEEEIMNLFFDGMTLAVGGFASSGVPRNLIELVIKSGVKDITLISNDPGDLNIAQGRFYRERIVKECYHSHVGLNPEFNEVVNEGNLTYHLIPQGNLVEKIRCGGAGLGGVLVDTGVGTNTEYEKNAEKITIQGKEWIVETPLRADISLVRARRCDTFGNLTFHGVEENYNPIIAMAGDITIVEADLICDPTEIQMDMVKLPGVFVNYILDNERRYL